MKVALFTETYLPLINGVVTHVKILKEGLERKGHEVLVVTADKNTKRHYVKDNILHCPAHEFKRFYGFGVAKPISRTRLKYIKDFNPDIIHIHNEFGIGLFGILAAKILRKPLVYTLHTMYDDYIYYIAPKPLIKLAAKISHQYTRFLASRANELTGPSKKCAEYFSLVGVKKDVNVIPNSVELEIFSPKNISMEKKAEFRAKYNIPADVMLACFVGRLGKEKSVDVLLDYWAKTIKPDEKIRLLIIGDGPERERLEKMAHELGIADMVTFTGKVMHDELPPYYASCDVYITASLSDTNSISMLEGMATGLPVLKRFDRLNENEVQNGKNGYIFNSPEEMAKELRQIKNLSGQELLSLKAEVIKSVSGSSADELASYMLDVYRKAIDSKK